MSHFAIRSIAVLADSTGHFRMSMHAVSDRVVMTDEIKAEIVARESKRGFPTEVVELTAEKHAQALAGELSGYATASSLDAGFWSAPWTGRCW